MASVYLTEIPNAPGIQEMPMPTYPAIPAIRHKPLDLTVDFSQEAASLQQQPLPGGFKRGSDIVAGALASGTKTAGVIGEGMQSVGRALSGAAGVLFKLQENAVKDQDAIAGQKAHENRQIFQARYEAETANMPMNEKLKWWNDHVGELSEMNSTYGASQLTRDKIASSDSAYAQVGSFKIQTDAAQKESQDAMDYAKNAISTALQNPTPENIEKAYEANDTGHRRQWWNDDTHTAQNDKIARAAKLGFIDEKAGDPASAGWIKEQAEKQQRGEKNDLFTKGDDPAMWNHADDVATKTITEGQRTNAEEYQKRLIEDPSKITKEDLKKQLDDGQLSVDQYAGLERIREGAPIPFDEGKVAEALSKATTYDRNSDRDSAGRPSMKKFDEAFRYIAENVPKEDQPEMLSILKANWSKTPDRDPQSQETKVAHANVDELFESNLLMDPATKKLLPSGMDKGKIRPGHEEEYRTASKRRAELHRDIEDYVKAHPDFTENELLDHIWGKAKGVVHSNVSSETAGVSTPVVSPDPGFYTKIGLPGRPILQGEKTPEKEGPPTPEEAKAAVQAVKEGKPAPTKALPAGPGAPVEVTVYDRGDRTFRQARLAATPELLSVVEDESKIYDVILKSDETSLRGRLGVVSGDALDPDMKEGIVREATKLSKEKGISLLDAGMEVIGGLKAQAAQDKIRIQEAIKNVAPTSAENAGAPISNIKVTNYTPGKNDIQMEGPNAVADRNGPAYTMEDFGERQVSYVTAAVNKNSPIRGQFFVIDNNPDFKGVTFKAEDIGSGVGPNQVDIAWRDPSKAHTGTKEGATIRVVDKIQARGGEISQTGPPTSAGPIKIVNAVDTSLPAMGRPRTAPITKIVMHGDVITDLDKLISVQKNDDRGYHYYIGTNGEIRMVVPPDHIANHIKGANSDSIGIVIAGADNGKMPTAAQDRAAKQLISQLARQYHINQQDVRGHGERQPDRRDVREGGNIAKDVREHGFV